MSRFIHYDNNMTKRTNNTSMDDNTSRKKKRSNPMCRDYPKRGERIAFDDDDDIKYEPNISKRTNTANSNDRILRRDDDDDYNDDISVCSSISNSDNNQSEDLSDYDNFKLSFKVSKKGCLSVYGLQSYPVSLYKDQWKALFGSRQNIINFIRDHDHELNTRHD